MQAFRKLLSGFAGFIVVLVVFLASLIALELSKLPSIDALSAYLPASPHMLEAQQCIDVRTLIVPLQTALHFREALLAAEGQQPSVQIARTLLCDRHENNLRRDLDGMLLTLRVRARFTADEQIAIFLNRVYFGDNQIGIESAAQHYLGRASADPTLPDQALLMGLIRSPSRFSPRSHPDRAIVRRNEVLSKMFEQGAITAEALKLAQSAPLVGTGVRTEAHAAPAESETIH